MDAQEYLKSRWKELTLSVIAAIVIVGLTVYSYTRKPSVSKPETVSVLTPAVRLDSMDVKMLGSPIEGPYLFSKVMTPNKVELTDMSTKAEQFELLGLLEGDYSSQPPEQGNATPTPELDAGAQDRLKRLWQFRTEGLTKLFDAKKQYYLVRMSEAKPIKVYLFQPESSVDKAKPAGLAQLVNAQALSKGIALLDLKASEHTFYRHMLDSQLTAYVKARRAPGVDVWSLFKPAMPAGTYEQRLGEIEKKS